jgi:hypothetical protein
MIAISNGTTAILLNISPDLLSVDETKKQNVPNIYPNPSSNKVSITIPENITGKITISIIDIYGKLISQTSEIAKEGTQELDVSALPVGIYFLRVAGIKGTAVYKFEKE